MSPLHWCNPLSLMSIITLNIKISCLLAICLALTLWICINLLPIEIRSPFSIGRATMQIFQPPMQLGLKRGPEFGTLPTAHIHYLLLRQCFCRCLLKYKKLPKFVLIFVESFFCALKIDTVINFNNHIVY